VTGFTQSRQQAEGAAKGKRESVSAWEAVVARARLGVDVPHQARTAYLHRSGTATEMFSG
jgi:hypothetical protein